MSGKTAVTQLISIKYSNFIPANSWIVLIDNWLVSLHIGSLQYPCRCARDTSRDNYTYLFSQRTLDTHYQLWVLLTEMHWELEGTSENVYAWPRRVESFDWCLPIVRFSCFLLVVLYLAGVEYWEVVTVPQTWDYRFSTIIGSDLARQKKSLPT